MTQPVHLAPRRSPYQGLEPYTEADYAYFFGRDQEITTIAANLNVARLTLFYGPSGVGKSSVLRAGVLYQLQQQAQANLAAEGRPQIIPVYFKQWHDNPLVALTRQIQSAAGQLDPALASLSPVADAALPPFATLEREGGLPPPTLPQHGGGTAIASERSLLPPQTGEGWGGVSESLPLKAFATLVARLTAESDSDLLLILDQFEEYFLYAATPGVDDFAQALIEAVNSPALRVNFLLGLREDALARLDHFKGRIPFLLDNRLTMPRLSYAGAQAAIEKPLAQWSVDQGRTYTIEPALTAAILDQLTANTTGLARQGQGAPGQSAAGIETPYLQLVLDRLWAEEQGAASPVMRLATLTRLHDTPAIVANYLNATMAHLADDERALAARFFDRLVTPSGSKVALAHADLLRFAGAAAGVVEPLVQMLLRQRILQAIPSLTGETHYEITHDVLGQAILAWQERYLAEQAEAQRLAEEQTARVVAENQARLAEERAAFEESARNAAEKLAWAQVKNAKQLRRLVFGLATILLIALATTIFAVIQTRLVTGSSLALEARNFARDQNLRMATLLALEARQLNPTQGDRLLDSEIPLQVSYSYAKSLFGHSADVNSVAWRPDGQQLASASDDNTVIIWDTTSGERVRTLQGHSARVLSVAWQPNGEQLASASGDNTVIIWDGASGERLRTLQGHNGTVGGVAWRPDGQQLASASGDNTVIIWDTASGERVRTLAGHSAAVWGVAWRPDGEQLASAAWDATVIIWDGDSGERIHTLQGHNGTVMSVAWRLDGQQLASAAWDATVIVWDTASGERVRTLQGHSAAVWSVAWRPNGQQLASASDDATVIVWDTASGERVRTLQGHSGDVRSVAWRPDGQRLASASDDNTVIIWDTASSERVRTLAGHSTGVRSVVWRPDGQQLASTSSDTTILLYPNGYIAPPCSWLWSNLTPMEWLRYRGWAIYWPTCSANPAPTLPTIMTLIDKQPELLLISWRGRLFLGALLLLGLLIIVLSIWGIVRLVRGWQHRLAAAG